MQISEQLESALVLPAPRNESKIRKNAAIILQGIKAKGDSAISFYTKQLHKIEISEFAISRAELSRAAATLPQSLRRWLSLAIPQAQKAHGWPQPNRHRIETSPSQWVWVQSSPIDSVGLYIENQGMADFGHFLNLVVMAQAAGVPRIAVCTPADSGGRISALVAYLAEQMGISEVYALSGAMAIGAMAIGTSSVAKVEKILGVGGAYSCHAAALLEADHKMLRNSLAPLILVADASTDLEKLALDVYLSEKMNPDAPIKVFFFDSEAMRKFAGILRAKVLFEVRKNPATDYPGLHMALAKDIQAIARWVSQLPSAHVALAYAHADSHLKLFSRVSGTVVSPYWHSCFLMATPFVMGDFMKRCRFVNQISPHLHEQAIKDLLG